MKISTQITTTVTITTALLVLALVLYIAQEAKQIQNKTAHSDMENTANYYAAIIDAKLEIPMDAARTIAQMFEANNSIPVGLRRSVMNKQLKSVLVQNPSFLGVWTCWESNALDKQDFRYANTKAHDETGRFVPYWYRNSDGINVEALKEYETDGVGDYYQLAKKTNNEVILDPYLYEAGDQQILITSLVVPIHINGEFAGVAGIDIPLEQIQQLVSEVTPYETGYSVLVSSDGKVAAHPENFRIGTNEMDYLDNDLQTPFLNAMKNKETYQFEQISRKTKNKTQYAAAPVQVGKSTNYWMFFISVPEKTIQAGVNQLNTSLWIAAILGLLLIAVIAWWAGRSIETNIQKMLTEVGAVIKASNNENFSYRTNYKTVHPDFHPVLIGFNEVMDTIVNKISWYKQLLDASPLGIVAMTSDRKFSFINKTAEELIGQDGTSLIDKPCSVWGTPLCNTENCAIEALHKGESQSFFTNLNTSHRVDISTINNFAGEEIGYIETVIDISRIQEKEKYNKIEIERLSSNLQIIANGSFNIDTEITPASKFTAQEYENFSKIYKSISTLTNVLTMLTTDMNQMYMKQASGDHEYYMDDTGYKGVYQQVAQGYNQVVRLHVDSIFGILEIIEQYGNGDFQYKMPLLPGKQIVITKTINNVRNNLLNVTATIKELTDKIKGGKINTKADSSSHKGEFKVIIEEINNSLDAITSPLTILIRDLYSFTKEIKNGNLTSQLSDSDQTVPEFSITVKSINQAINAVINPLNIAIKHISHIAMGNMSEPITDEYKGDFNQMKESINNLISINQQIAQNAKQIADGDLTTQLYKRSENDELIVALQSMTEKIKSIVVQTNESANNVAAGSIEISNNAAAMAQSANEQATSVEEISASIEEMQATISQNTLNANQTKETALKAAVDIEKGSNSVQTTIDAMHSIIDTIQIVSEIADKTDLLAINAAIEAARAGEHGDGFAVVAGEIRKLAETSKSAAKEINQLSKNSLKIAEESGILLKNIVPQINNTAQLTQEINVASQEQQGGIQQITTSILEMNNLSQQNAASAEELSTGSEELTSQADMLREIIRYFKIGNKQAINSQQNANTNFKTNNETIDSGISINLSNNKSRDNEFEQF